MNGATGTAPAKVAKVAKATDIQLQSIGGLEWTDQQREPSISAIADQASKKAREISEWYLSKKARKQRWAVRYRGGAIICTAVAAVLPVLSQMQVNVPLLGTSVQPALASIVLALAGTLIALDQFGGFSSAWMRFVAAEMKIKSLHSEFELDYQAERASWRGQPPTDEQMQRALSRIKIFVQGMNSVVEDETNTWIQEFKATLKTIEDQAKSAAEATKAGAINVIIENGDQATGWTIAIDDAHPIAKRGKTATFSNIFQGKHKITVSGKIGGVDKSAETTVELAPGALATVPLKLE
jgi:hypothetical protein